MNDFDLLQIEIEKLKKEIVFFNIGKTVFNNNIVCFVLGDKESKNKILLQGGIHAREYITSFLLIELSRFLKNFKFDACVYVLPLMNPDGIKISLKGKNVLKNFRLKEEFEKFNVDLKLIKCNARGVDLNTNFDAMWGCGKKNVKAPCFENFVGYKAESENEVKAIKNLTEVLKPKLTISYHSKGEVFYWGFNKSANYNKEYLNIEERGKKVIARTTGYKAIYTKGSCGGYKDWCIDRMKIPSFTLEVGEDVLSHPIKLTKLKSIFDKNKFLVLNLIKEIF